MWKLIVLFAIFVSIAGAATNSVWSQWSSYGNCTNGTITRTRICNGGTRCPGSSKMSLECTCGRENYPEWVFIISGGTHVDPNQYPWMVSIPFIFENGDQGECGGSLISGIHVLTAKHCTLDDHSKPVYFKPLKLGIHNKWNDKYKEVEVEKVIYPDVDMRDHDIAILVLKNNVHLRDPKIGTLCLPKSENENYTGKHVKGMGWGMVAVGHSGTGDLKEVDLVVSDVTSKYYLFTNLDKKNGVWQDPCAGDSGGPLVYKISGKWTVIGTVQGGGFDCRTGIVRPGGGKWNKVTAHLKWIKNVIGEGKGCTATRGSIRNKCVFPFKFKGVSYNGCTEKASADKPWCATAVKDNGDQTKWGYCEDSCPVHRDCKTTAKELCVFPFKYMGSTYNECATQVNADDWCATQVDANGNHIKWGICGIDC